MWTESDVASLLHLNSELLQTEGLTFGKVDIARGALLYQHGGLYIDADILYVGEQCLDSVMELASTTGFLAAIEPGDLQGTCQNFVSNGVMGAVKHHPIVKQYMYVQSIFQSSKGAARPVWERLGPLALSAAISIADNFQCETNKSHVHAHLLKQQPAMNSALATVLHPQYFYPEAWHGNKHVHVHDLAALREEVAKEFPLTMMFQFGLTTNHMSEGT